MRNAKDSLLYNWFEQAWNNGRKEAIDEFMTSDVIAHGLYPEGMPQGIESFKTFYDDFKKQLTNITVTVDDVIAQDDMEAALTTVTATHIPTGKPVNFTGICYARIKDGKIAEAWNNYDFLTMYGQVGMELVGK